MSTLLKEGMMHNLCVEVGRATLASNTVEVATKLKKVLVGFGTYYEAPGAAVSLYTDCAISSGAVTFADATIAAKEFQYILLGYR